jgi:hypothetical protein
MAVLEAKDILDVLNGALADLGRGKFEDISQDTQRLEVFSKWFKEDRVEVQSGNQIQRNLLNNRDNEASHPGVLDPDSANIPNVLVQLQVPWRHYRTKWAVEYRTDLLMNSEPAQIVDTVQLHRTSALIDLAEELESKAWASPSSSNKTDPYGIPYWVVRDTSTGFNGGAPTGHTTVGGIDLTTSPNFKNYTAQYTNVTKQDAISLMRDAHRSIDFRSPVSIPQYRDEVANPYRIYVNLDTVNAMEAVGEGQNENLGRDIAPYDETISFRRHPIMWIPKLDSDTNDPIYMINTRTFHPVVLRGDHLRETEPRQSPNQVNVYESYVFGSYNYICTNRRRNALIAK